MLPFEPIAKLIQSRDVVIPKDIKEDSMVVYHAKDHTRNVRRLRCQV